MDVNVDLPFLRGRNRIVLEVVRFLRPRVGLVPEAINTSKEHKLERVKLEDLASTSSLDLSLEFAELNHVVKVSGEENVGFVLRTVHCQESCSQLYGDTWGHWHLGQRIVERTLGLILAPWRGLYGPSRKSPKLWSLRAFSSPLICRSMDSICFIQRVG